LLGVLLGVMGLLRICVWGYMGWFRDVDVNTHYRVFATTVGVSVVGVVLWGTLIGAMLPFILKRVGLDPATSSAPFVATLVDVVGVMLYLGTAVLILKGTLL
ncbi:MAG: magnesium transporter, partial [Phycisphaerales bacterium]